MDKQSFIEKLKLLNLPLGEYYILSSGSLLLYGLREQVGDIDLCVSQKLFDVFLKDKYLINEQDKNECGFYKLYDDIEFIVNDGTDPNYKFEYDIVDGYPVQKLGIILRDKKKRNLPKDQRDIENINRFLLNNFVVCDIKDRQEFIEEVAILTQNEWGDKSLTAEEFNVKVKNKIEKIKSNLHESNYCKLLLLFRNELVGFISIFLHDCDERMDLTPWYATMFVKLEYRGMGYSKILNDAILKEAKKRGFSRLYLKTDLNNYYEKFGARYIEDLNDGERLYYFDI